MTRKRRPAHPRPPAAEAPPPEETDDAVEETPPGEAELRTLALDRLAQALHPELFMALQETLPEKDARWITLFAHAFDEAGELSPLLRLKPVSLNPVTFDLDGARTGAASTVERLTGIFNRFPARQNAWAARISFHVIAALGEDLCAALGRDGMGEVIGAVEGALLTPAVLLPSSLEEAPFPLEVERVRQRALVEAPAALARAWLGSQLEVAFPEEDDEELDHLVTEAMRGLDVQMGPAPAFSLEVRAADRPWLPISNVMDALRRRLGGGLRVMR